MWAFKRMTIHKNGNQASDKHRRILSPLLLSCVVSMPGRAAATRRKSWKEREPDVFCQTVKYGWIYDKHTSWNQKKNMQRVFIQKIHLKLTQRKTQTELCQIWRQLNSMSLSICSTINYAAKTELFWDLPSRELGQFQGVDSNEFVHCMLMLNMPALGLSSVTLN